jgi:hypothetical protein
LPEPEIADGLALEGFAIDDQPSRRMVGVTLQWRALSSKLPKLVPWIRFRQGNVVYAGAGSRLLEEQYPTTEWREGEVMIEHRDIRYPQDGNRAALEIAIGEHAVELAEIELEKIDAVFQVPPMQHSIGVQFGDFAKLLGYDIGGVEIRTNEKVSLSLYWQAISEKPILTRYSVFAHLLSEDGQLIGQHDGEPAGDMRPTLGWTAGEIIVDTHEMPFDDLTYEGKARIEVGLYESLTIERVVTEDGRDHIILPTEIMVRPKQQ